MTTEELNTIVQAVVDKINGQVIDFDVVSSAPESTDLLSAVRSQGDGTYQGVTLKWDDVANAVTREAKGYRDEAASAKTNVENMKASVDQTVSDFNILAEQKKAEVQGVYQTDLNKLKGDLDTERNARIEADTDHTTRLQKVEVASSVNRYEIDNLKAKAEGKLYRTETVEAKAYALDVPSSVAPYAEVQKIGGKSVVWNQIQPKDSNKVSNFFTTHKYVLISTANVTVDSIDIYAFMRQDNYTHNNQITMGKYGVGTHRLWWISSPSEGTSDIGQGAYFVTESGCTFSNKMLIDLTLMFGAGNEPTLEECQKIFSADYYPYDEGTIKSFPVKRVVSKGKNLLNPTLQTTTKYGITCTNNGDGTYTVNGTSTSLWNNFNLIRFNPNKDITLKVVGAINKCYITIYNSSTQTIELNIGTNGGLVFTFIADNNYSIDIVIQDTSTVHNNDIVKPMLTTDLNATYDDFVPYRDPIEYDVSSLTTDLKSTQNAHDEWQNGKKVTRIGERAYTEGDESDSTLLTDGTTTYYPLDTPIEETVSEIDNYFEVEGGGTLTFESDDTVKMPIPSTTRFVVDLTSTTEETT